MGEKSDAKPIWSQKMSIEDFYKCSQTIKKVTHHWEMTGVDTSRDWIELHPENGKPFRKPAWFEEIFIFRPDHRGLFVMNYNGERARMEYEEIKKWEAKNKKELAEYNRLKAKFGGNYDAT